METITYNPEMFNQKQKPMNTKTLTEQQQEKLREPLPDQAVSVHPTKPYLSSIKSIYVTERFNEVFGIGGWTADARVVDSNEGAPVVYVTFQAPEYGITLSQFGGNDNGGVDAKNYDLGDAYKGAFTDALTKIASYMDVGADVFKGLQRGDNPPKGSTKKQEPKKPAPKPAPEPKEEPKKDTVDLSDAESPAEALDILRGQYDSVDEQRTALLAWYTPKQKEDADFKKKYHSEMMQRMQNPNLDVD